MKDPQSFSGTYIEGQHVALHVLFVGSATRAQCRAHDHHIVRDHGRRAVADVARRVALEIQIQLLEKIDASVFTETWNRYAGLGIERDQMEPRKDRKDPLILSIRPIGHATSGISSWRLAIPFAFIRAIHPQRIAGPCIRSDYGAVIAGGEIKNSIDVEWGRLALELSPAEIVGLPRPGDFEVLHILTVDLIQWGIARASQLAPVGPPLSIFRAVLRQRWQC